MHSPVWKVTKFEFVRQVKKPAFWASILLMPVLIGVVFLIGMIAGVEPGETNPELSEGTTLAVTDEAGLLAPGTPYVISGGRDDGVQMVKNGEVDLYYYIPANFTETKKVEFYHISEGLDLFNMDANILKGILAETAASRVNPTDAIILTGGYEIEDNKLTADGEAENALGKAVVPIMILMVYFMFVALFGNRFLLAVVEEKENRISEMILTSVSAKHLIAGKIIAMMMLGVIQIVTFVVPVLLLVMVNQNNPVVSTIVSSIEIEPVTIAMNLTLFVASVFFYAGTCVFVGSLVSTARDASSFIGPAIVAMVFPLYFMQLFLAGEPSMMVYFLTYFPLSSPIALMLRSAFGTLGTVEFVIGLAEVTVLAVVMTRLAVKTFQKNALNFEMVRPKFLRKR